MTTDDQRIERVFADDDLVLRIDDSAGEDGRTLTGYILPWNRAAKVAKPIAGWESYKRGALTRTLAEAASRGREIPLLGLHAEASPAAKLVDSYDDDFGQHATFRLFDTTVGRDTAELVREGIWTGLSVGGAGIPARTKVTRSADGRVMVRRSEIRLDHVGILRNAAFTDAKVLALRGHDGDLEHLDDQDGKLAREAGLWSDDLRTNLRDALKDRFPSEDRYLWVRDFTAELVVFEVDGDDDPGAGTWQLPYTITDTNTVELDGAKPTKVAVRTTYEPLEAVVRARRAKRERLLR